MQAVPSLGQLLVKSGMVSQQALDEVLVAQRADGRRLGEHLAERSLVHPTALAQFLSHQLACPWVSLQRVEVAREAVAVLPAEIAIKHHMVPVHLRTSKGATALYVAMDDPTDDVALSEATRAATMPVKPMVALSTEIRIVLSQLYGIPLPEGMVVPPPISSGSVPPNGSTPAPPQVTPNPPVVAVANGAHPSPNPNGHINGAIHSAPPPAATLHHPSKSPPAPPVAPLISVKDETGAVRGPMPAIPSNRPPKPPPPKPSGPPPAATKKPDDSVREELSILEDVDDLLVSAESDPDPIGAADDDDDSEPPVSRPHISTVVVVISESESLLLGVRALVSRIGAEAIRSTVEQAAFAAADFNPSAMVVTETIYETNRAALDRLALDHGFKVVVSTPDFKSGQLDELLENAIRRWRRASYDKGTILEGRYELLRDLGGRITGSRWEVRHIRTQRRSMLKVGVRAAHDETDAEAVRREQQALARVNHRSAVDLRDAGNTELGDPYVVTEMLEGKTLEGLVAARGPIPAADACNLITEIARCLVAAHDGGVRHGAVRPDNVLIVRDEWGVERAKLVHWEAATVMGGDITMNAAHDLAGLGACAFLALAGRTRNEGEDIATTAGLPPKVGAVVARAISGRDRFPTVKAFTEAFEQATAWSADAGMTLLSSNPERRGPSLRPGATAAGSAEAPLPSELRQFRRAAYRTPVRIEMSGVGSFDGRTEDISEGGVYVVSRESIPDGADVTIRFALPIEGRIVTETGVVRWTRGPKSNGVADPRAIGIEWSAVGEDTVKEIARYVSFMAAD